MGTSTDKNLAQRLLRGLENGSLSANEARTLAEDLDPVLVYSIGRFLRETHPASDPAASAILERLVELTTAYPAMVEVSKEGEQDPVSQWFSEAHSFDEFRGRGDALLEVIVDKLET